MCLNTTGRGLYHNLKDWNYKFCGDFKVMEQDRESALRAFYLLDNKDLYNKLVNWNFDINGGFRIKECDHEQALMAFKKLGDKEESLRRAG